jgi:hypothetical protein
VKTVPLAAKQIQARCAVQNALAGFGG